MKKSLFLAFIFVRAFAAFGQVTSPAQAQPTLTREVRWHEDLKVLAQLSDKAKPFQDDAKKRAAFLSIVHQLSGAVAEKSDAQILVGMLRAAALAHDGHTTINLADAHAHYYPLDLYWFKEGIYVDKAAAANQQLLGARLLAINHLPVKHLVELLRGIVSHDNDSYFRAAAPLDLICVEVLEGLGVTHNQLSAVYTFRLEGGSQVDVALDPDPDYGAKLISFPNHQIRNEKPDEYYWWESLPAENAIYFKYNHCDEMANKPFSSFQQELLQAMDRKHSQLLIIDLRDNSGGDDSILRPMIDALARRRTMPNPVRLYVLMGRYTFSSAVLNTIDLKLKVGALLVGEPSGARPNHYGFPTRLELPNSHIRIHYSTTYWNRWPSNTGDSIKPDIPAVERWVDFSKSVDAALNAALRDAARQ